MAKPTARVPASRPQTARELGIMQGFPPPRPKRPTLDNWDHPPYNRWSFQNVRSLIPTVDVYRGDGEPRVLERDIQDVSGITFSSEDGTTKTIQQFLFDTYTDGFLLLHRGKVASELYFNDMTSRTLHLSQSVAKSIVGVTAGILAGKSLLDPDAGLIEYVPELSDCGYRDATVQHVLDMTSGVRFTEDYGAPDSDMTRIDIASGWRPAPISGPTDTIRDVILTLPKVREHGEIFEYRSIETDVLAWAMERASGQSLAELVSGELWQKIGAERDAYFTVDTAGTVLADGGFNATLRDYARFGQVMLAGGRIRGAQLVTIDWIGRTRTGDRSRFGAPYTTVSPNGAYSHQWWIHDVGEGDFMARGVFGQMIYLDPNNDILVVKLSTWPDYLNTSFTIDTLRAISTITRELN